MSRGFSASVKIEHEEFYERKPLNFGIGIGWQSTPMSHLELPGNSI